VSENGNSTELIYVPAPSWLPAFVAVGIALVIAGLWTSYVVSVLGAILLIPSLIAWFRDIGAEVSRLPVDQRSLTAVLPAEAGESD
jgi:hypothetical protein